MTAPASRPVIDVSQVPESALDHRSTIWWGNLLLLAIETTMIALLVAAYFYLRGNFDAWPPPQSNWAIARYATDPALGFATVNLALILFSVLPMALADRAALRHDCPAVLRGMTVCVILGFGTIALRFREFADQNFRWDDNAYGSVVCTLLGIHLLHLIVGTLENITLLTWLYVRGMDKKHARDVRVGAVYWYWIAAIWVPLYAVLYLVPRFI